MAEPLFLRATVWPVITLVLVWCLDSTPAYDPYTNRYRAASYSSYGQYLPNQNYNYGYGVRSYNYHHQHQPYYTPVYRSKQFLPGPQYCPETGRTVCSKVSTFYPTDEVFSVLRMARAKKFNISSEFVDESENDSEPNFEDSFSKPPASTGFHSVHEELQQTPMRDSTHYPKSPALHYHNFDYSNLQQSTEGNSYHSAKSLFSYSSEQHPVISTGRYKRQADSLPIEPICPSRVIVLEPKAALNDKSQWKYIVNLSDRDPRLKQAIKVEVCVSPNQPCSNEISLPFGFTSRCKQKYIKKKLISLDESGQSISSENFFAPSCCVCEVTRNSNSQSTTRKKR